MLAYSMALKLLWSKPIMFESRFQVGSDMPSVGRLSIDIRTMFKC